MIIAYALIRSRRKQKRRGGELLKALVGFHRLKDFHKDPDCAIFSRLIENHPHVDSSVCQYCSNVIYVPLDRVAGSQPSSRQLKHRGLWYPGMLISDRVEGESHRGRAHFYSDVYLGLPAQMPNAPGWT